MATLKIILAGERADGKKQVKFRITNNRANTVLSTKLYVQEADFDESKTPRPIRGSHPMHANYNMLIEAKYRELDNAIYKLTASGLIDRMTPGEIAEQAHIIAGRHGQKTFWDVRNIIVNECACVKTMEMYRYMSRVIAAYTNGEKKSLTFDKIDKLWLDGFIKYMSTHSMVKGRECISKNTQAIILRHMRVIYNRAIDMDLIHRDKYPFRKIVMPARKKTNTFVDINVMRRLRDARLKKFSARDRARDLFMLSLYMCGVNPIDLWNMNATDNGYVTFIRQKTSSRNGEEIRLRLQPEAQEIINKWKGSEGMLLNYSQEFSTYESFYANMRHRLNELCGSLGIQRLTFYDARYSWATYAFHEDVPEYVIDKSLAHASRSLADRHYITYDWRKTDKANRMVIDLVSSDRPWEDDVTF